MVRKIGMSELVDLKVSEEEDAPIRTLVEQAEKDITNEARVNLRWPNAQLDVIKHAAALYGMPYQTYLKQAAFRQALTDLDAVKDATVTTAPKDKSPG